MSMEFGKLNFSVSFKPTSAFPLDARSYFESYDEAVNAAKTAQEVGSKDSIYYFGQTVAVVERGAATLYTIQPDGTLSEVGGKVEINENVFAHTVDGKLDLYGFADAVAGAQLVKGSDGKLSWVKPDTSTVEGLQTTVETLRTDLDKLSTVVGKKAGDNEVATGIFLELDGKANKTEVYTKNETDSAISTAVANAEHLKREKVDSVDVINNRVNDPGVEKIIFMVPKAGSNGDHYDEYMVIDKAVERVGDWEVDLSEYAKTVDVESKLSKKVDVSEDARLMLKTEGVKLDGIEEGAQVNTINSVSQEFEISKDGSKLLNIKAIDKSKITGLNEALATKVNAEVGKGLSTNDLTNELLKKLNDSDENLIEIIKMNGQKLNINTVDKSVDINIPTATTDTAGMVKSSAEENKVSVADGGIMEVNNININKLIQTEGDTLILNGGSASK